MIVSAAEMRALEEAAFARGATPESLMEEAGERCAAALLEFFPRGGTCLVVFGKGNNGGDALVVGRILAHARWKTHLIPAFPQALWSNLTRQKWEEAGLGYHTTHGVAGFREAVATLRRPAGPVVIIDGMLGIGSQGKLREPLASLVTAINEHRAQQRTHQVVALDLPTGLEAESGEPGQPCLQADLTLTVGATKRGLVADAATPFVGRLAEIQLPGLDEAVLEGAAMKDRVSETSEFAQHGLRRRSFDTHKGECGRVAVVAGSCGLTGAARLASEGCVRAGAGLVTLYVPEEAYAIVAASAAPEVMVQGVKSYRAVLEARHDVLAIGPGLGQERAREVRELLCRTKVPAVIDADALNILALDLDVLEATEAPKLLTPHPGEMARLDPTAKGRPRREVARAFVERHPVTLLLKGARTLITSAPEPVYYNTTGNPGMATGGMGDVLTGVCAALVGQGCDVTLAARLGAWVCGRACELAVQSGEESGESLTPVSLLKYLGRAFEAMHRQGF